MATQTNNGRPTQSSLRPWAWTVAIVTAYAVSLLWMATALRSNLGFPLDDSWIHQVIARNLVTSHTIGFIPGVTSSGSSSTLWTFVLALHYLLFANASPIWYPLAVNAVLLTGIGLLLWRLAVADGLSHAEIAALTLLPALSGNLVWLAFIGMEHVLFMFLSVLAILLWFRPAGDTRAVLAAGLALGALGMTRPEGLALALLLFALYRFCDRTSRDLLRAGATALVFLVPSFAINLWTSGTLLPTTMKGRRFLYIGSIHLHPGRSTVISLTRETYQRILQHHFFHTTSQWVELAVALAVWGTIVLVRRFPNRTAMLCLWATLHYACYCFILPAAGHGGRYQPFVLLLFPAVMAIGGIDLARRAARLVPSFPITSPVPATAVLALAAIVTALTLPRWQVALRDSIFDINNSHRKMAAWINDNIPAGTPMGVFDIGNIGYFANIRLYDLGGLVDSKFVDYLATRRVPQYLDEKHLQYVVMPHNGAETRFGDQLNLLHNPTLRLVPLHTDGIDYATWNSSYVYTQHAFRFQTLYRVEHVPRDQQTAQSTERFTRIAINAVPDTTDEALKAAAPVPADLNGFNVMPVKPLLAQARPHAP
jgi:hypothetical protein